MTEENSEVQSFDIEKYRVSSELIPQKIKIESTGDEFEIKLRPLSWSKRSQMMSEHVKMKISGDPEKLIPTITGEGEEESPAEIKKGV